MASDRDRKDVAETVEKDIQFLQHLEDTMMDARRLLNALVRDYTTMDETTLNETLARVHTMVVDDLYYRVHDLAEHRGVIGEYQYDVAVLIQSAGELSVEDQQFHSKLIGLYFRILARYQYWLDQMGILLTNVPFNANFAAELTEDMRKEFSEWQLQERLKHTDAGELAGRIGRLSAVKNATVTESGDVQVELSDPEVKDG